MTDRAAAFDQALAPAAGRRMTVAEDGVAALWPDGDEIPNL